MRRRRRGLAAEPRGGGAHRGRRPERQPAGPRGADGSGARAAQRWAEGGLVALVCTVRHRQRRGHLGSLEQGVVGVVGARVGGETPADNRGILIGDFRSRAEDLERLFSAPCYGAGLWIGCQDPIRSIQPSHQGGCDSPFPLVATKKPLGPQLTNPSSILACLPWLP